MSRVVVKPSVFRNSNTLQTQGFTSLSERSETEIHFHALLEAMSEGAIIQGADGNILAINSAAQALLGDSGIGKNWGDANFPWTLLDSAGEPFSYEKQPWLDCLRRGQPVRNQTLGVQRADGSLIWLSANLKPVLNEGESARQSVITTFTEITAGHVAEPVLSHDINQLQPLLEAFPSPFFAKDSAGRYTACNHAFEEYLDIPREQLIGKTVFEIAPGELADKYHAADQQLFDQPGTQIYEAQVRWSDSSLRDVIFHKATMMGDRGEVLGLSGIIVDITERKKIETNLRQQEKLYRSVVEHSPDLIVRYDTQLRRTYVNPAWEKSSGLSAVEVVGKDLAQLNRVKQPVNNDYMAALQKVLTSGSHESINFLWENAYGKTLSLQYLIVPEHDNEGKVISLLAVGRDVTEVKQTEQALLNTRAHLLRVNRALKTLSAGIETLVRAGSEQELLQQMCQVIVQVGGHVVTSISELKDDGMTIENRAFAMQDSPELNDCACTSNCRAVISAITRRRPVVIHDMLNDPLCSPCKKRLQSCNIRSALIQPLWNEGENFGALSIYSADQTAFDENEVALLTDMADDLAYGIRSLRNRQHREEGMRHIQATMEATIQALANTVEFRDPYTAGHQQRVAQLSRAIAKQLGLDDKRIKGLYLASVVHDIGKIRVPSEVLTRPGKLSHIEMEMVKTHVEASFDILKSIDFPWPIAKIVMQHHERMNGSGYPLGIFGDEILMESRILAVADVVEAIASFRPYRPALGIEVALQEIDNGRGSLFDNKVVDACIHLFREKGYRIE